MIKKIRETLSDPSPMKVSDLCKELNAIKDPLERRDAFAYFLSHGESFADNIHLTYAFGESKEQCIYKIRNKRTGEFFPGGEYSRWGNGNGKIYNKKGYAKSRLTQIKRRMERMRNRNPEHVSDIDTQFIEDAEIVGYRFVEVMEK